MHTPIAPESMLPPSMCAPPWAVQDGETPKFPKLKALEVSNQAALDARFGEWFRRVAFRRRWDDLDVALKRPHDASVWLMVRLSKTRRWVDQLEARQCLWALIEAGHGDAVREAAASLGEGVFETLELDDPYAWYPRRNFPQPMLRRVAPKRLPALLTKDRAFRVSDAVAQHVAAALVGSQRVLYRGVRELMECVDTESFRAFAWALAGRNIDLPHMGWVITLMEHALGDRLVEVARYLDDEYKYGLNAGTRQVFVEEVERVISGLAYGGSYWGRLAVQELGRSVCLPIRGLSVERYAAQACFARLDRETALDLSTPHGPVAPYATTDSAPDVNDVLERLRRAAPDPVRMLRLAMRAPGPVEPVVLDYMRGHGVRVDAWRAEFDAADGVGVGVWDEGWSRGARTMHHLQCERMEDALVGQRRWSRKDFVALLERRALAAVALPLVWGVFDLLGRGVPERIFGFTPDGATYDARGRKVSLKRSKKTFGLVHPAYLTDDQRAFWAERIAAHWGMQPIAQLRRGVYDASGLKTKADVADLCARLEHVRVTSEVILGLLGGVWQRRGKFSMREVRAELASSRGNPQPARIHISPSIDIPSIPLYPRLDPYPRSTTHEVTLDLKRMPSRLHPHLGSELLRVVRWLEACHAP